MGALWIGWMLEGEAAEARAEAKTTAGPSTPLKSASLRMTVFLLRMTMFA